MDEEIVFHLKCFACHSCKLPLKTGDHFSFNNGLLFCKQHLPQNDLDLMNISKSDQLAPNINSALANLCQQQQPQSLISQLPPVPINNPLTILNQQSTICNSTTNQDNLQSSNLNNLIICSSNNLPSNHHHHHFKGEMSVSKDTKEQQQFVRSRGDGRRGPKRPRTILTTGKNFFFSF